jgi:hypothetical protein
VLDFELIKDCLKDIHHIISEREYIEGYYKVVGLKSTYAEKTNQQMTYIHVKQRDYESARKILQELVYSTFFPWRV